MKIHLDIRKSLEENAAIYFEKAKKAKRRMKGIDETIERMDRKIDELKVKTSQQREEQEKRLAQRPVKREWFEKFRWCMSSDGFLIAGGRDATTNEIIVKKHMEQNDLVFHTESPGSPFVLIKNPENREIPDSTKEEAAALCGIFSNVWKAGIKTAEVFMVKPEQVSKEAMSGEYLSKGSFMIYGKKEFLHLDLKPAVTAYEGKVMCGPLSAVKFHAEKNSALIIEFDSGKDKVSDVAKTIKYLLKTEDLDEVIRNLPQNIMIKKQKKK